MELKTIKEFCHKNNLGEGLEYKNGKFQVNIDNELNTIATALTDLNENKANKDDLSTLYKVKGSSTVADINVMTPEVGWVYNLTDSGTIINGLTGEVPVDAGDNVVYTDSGWDKLSAATKIALEAGDNISIEGNIISALGYTYDKEKEAFSTGSGSATGEKSYAEGGETEAVGAYSHAEGRFTVASGLCSHAEGSETNATSTGAHAEGCFTSASYASHAEGYGTSANGRESHAEGSYTEANNPSEHAEGSYNISNKNSGDFRDPLNTIHSIGIGYVNKSTLKPIRKNAWEVMLNGDAYLINVGGYKGKNPAEAQTLQEVINFKVDKEEGKYLSSNDYTNSDKEKVSLIKALQTIVLELQEKVNSKEYSIDFESDSTTAQEINLMNSMSLKKLVGYNITGVNLQIGTGSAINLVLTDNVWEGDPIVINQGERIYWDIIKYDESAPAVLGIYETKIL